MTDETRRGYRVEITIDATPDEVWSALRDRETLERWFGWDYADLGPEIELIFFTAATADEARRRLDLGNRSSIELVDAGARTVVRVVQAGPVDDSDWAELYDGEREGWRQFFVQLRHMLRRGRGEGRRTLRLSGRGAGRAVLDAVDRRFAGPVDDEGPFQRTTRPGSGAVGLANVCAEAPFARGEVSDVALTLTTHGLDEEGFGAFVAETVRWWEALTEPPRRVEQA